jgi:superfamily II DNA or RNA helicase
MQAEKTTKGMNVVVDETINIAKEQHRLTLESGMPYSKILFAMEGTDDIRKIIVNIAKIKKQLPTHRIFTIMSNEKYGAMIDGEKTIKITHAGQIWENKISRSVFFQQLREADNALIFHYDIISEGIDIDGITGVVINRNMSLSKLLQTIGRAVRKYKANPAAKPQAWVTVTAIDGDEENHAWVASVIENVRAGGFLIENIAFSGTDGPGTEDDPDLPDQYGIGMSGTLQTILQNIIHTVEEGVYFKKIASMSVDELIEYAILGKKKEIDLTSN